MVIANLTCLLTCMTNPRVHESGDSAEAIFLSISGVNGILYKESIEPEGTGRTHHPSFCLRLHFQWPFLTLAEAPVVI